MDDRRIFTLQEVARSIQKTLRERYTSSFWVKAEMNKLNRYVHSGHCYPELVEKSGTRVIAQLRSILWKDDYHRINQNFIRLLSEPLKDGIKVLLLVTISFDPVHGLALNIQDIDPSFTLGDLEKEKLETIQTLKQEGIFDSNKQKSLPLLPQRIAVISVETSKGYADFLSIIHNNPHRYSFFHFLFPSLLQGEGAVKGIIAQLRKIKKLKKHFDLVAIIRGGGGDVGLSCYNDLRLAREIALFPLPVLTGIGHATNETVVEMVAFNNAITPTKLAEMLLAKFDDFAFPLTNAQRIITSFAAKLLSSEKYQFASAARLFRNLAKNLVRDCKKDLGNQQVLLRRSSRILLKQNKDRLREQQTVLPRSAMAHCRSCRQEFKHLSMVIRKESKFIFKHTHKSLAQESETVRVNALKRTGECLTDILNLEKQVMLIQPENVLKRGYSITLLNGKVLKTASPVKPGDVIETRLAEGGIRSVVQSKSNSEDEI